MCGIAGVFSLGGGVLPRFNADAMLASLRHRGPDDEGRYRAGGIFLGSRRLAIIDPAGGRQPVADESGRLHLVMNGEIFDHDALLAGLAARGHRLASRCDTEAAVHLFEERAHGALDVIDGQYALAVHDAARGELLLARDRMGICPLFYVEAGDCLIFASEMKGIFASGLIRPEIDPRALDAMLAFGCVPNPRTVFKGVRSLGPGQWLAASAGGTVSLRRYWDIPYPDAGDYAERSADDWAAEFRELLGAACRRRLRADVPVGLYLSGGIDSSAIAALTAGDRDTPNRVFSLSFPEPGFDESRPTASVAHFLGLKPQFLRFTQKDLAGLLPRMIRHAETPLLMTESVPLMGLSALAARHVKVVLTGEGADEALGGYQYFRWDRLKAACEGGLAGRAVLALLRRRFAHIAGETNPFFPPPSERAWAAEVFGFYPAAMMNFFYCRQLRSLILSPEMVERQHSLSDAELLDLPRDDLARWDGLNRSLYVSSRVIMAGHLLAAHGDRAMMANSVEGRYPFLDRSVQEFLARVPPRLKTGWRTEKTILRRAMRGLLPGEVLRRRKKQFLAPAGTPFVGPEAPAYARELLSERALAESGFFDAAKVRAAVRRLEELKPALATDRGDSLRLSGPVIERTVLGMAVTFALTTQVLAEQVRRGELFAPQEAALPVELGTEPVRAPAAMAPVGAGLAARVFARS
jgi:asparagine synthase (glutamine-hydrolysing)